MARSTVLKEYVSLPKEIANQVISVCILISYKPPFSLLLKGQLPRPLIVLSTKIEFIGLKIWYCFI